MNDIRIITIRRNGVVIFTAACPRNMSEANWIAGELMDRVADNHGGDCGYEVTDIPYIHAFTPIGMAHDAVEASRAAIEAA